ncbi:MAG: type I restriction-modification system subunit M [Endomicrobium sp.]|nr:type I restriction-modification system subunit M [Endomicrobium sp.]
MFEQIFKNIDDALRKDAGCSSELDYTEQSSWLLFLKYLQELENDKRIEADLAKREYEPILKKNYSWDTWAAAKNSAGIIDQNKILTGDDLRNFVNIKLFPYLKSLRNKADYTNTIHYKIGEIFSEITNKIQSGYVIRDIVNYMDQLRFQTQNEKFELSVLYEDKIKRMGNAGRNGGEYYTPRPLIRAMIEVIQPQIGETVYDGAVGSAGFLCETFIWMRKQYNLSRKDLNFLNSRTFFGQEKKSLAYFIAMMNMILHGIESPNLIHMNSLLESLNNLSEKDRFNVILTNPPFGGNERKEVQENFDIKTRETAYLFLQHFIKKLKKSGRAGIVIKNTFLSNTDDASVQLRKLLLEECNLHTVLDMPVGTFQGVGVKTVILFFQKGESTKSIWYYQLDPEKTFGKTNPLHDDDLNEFVKLQKSRKDSPHSWIIKINDIDTKTWDLAIKNPNKNDDVQIRSPLEILDKIEASDKRCKQLIDKIRGLL